jgi:hypothetical protein
MNIRLLILAAGTIIMIVVMSKTGATLTTPATPYGILNLEFASNIQLVNDILLAWQKTASTNNVKAAIINTLLDFIFLIFYSLFLNSLCNNIAAKLNATLSVAGKIFAKAALLAGVLDVIENMGMLLSLNSYLNNAIAITTFTAAAFKWFFVLVILLYVIIGGPLVLLNKYNNKSN